MNQFKYLYKVVAFSFLLLISGNNFSYAQVINFDVDSSWTQGSGSFTSYQNDHTYQDQDWLFTGGPALRNTISVTDGFPGALGTYSWRLRDGAGVAWTATYQGDEVITQFGFDVRRWNASPNPNYRIEYSFDGGTTYKDTGDVINNAFLNNSSDWFTYTFELPIIQHHDEGDFIVRLSRDGGERIMIDNFTFGFASTDKDSQILAPSTQIPEGDLVVGEAIFTNDAVPVFLFQIEDSGQEDDLPTRVKSMRFIGGPENTADFSEIIENVVIRVDGIRICNLARELILNENSIDVIFDYAYTNPEGCSAESNLVIPDNESKVIEVSVSLKETGVDSGDIVQLAIDDNSLGFGVGQDSSIFSRSITPIVGNEFEVKVNATQLSFIQQPQYALVNSPMPLGVRVATTDANGNIDRSYTGTIRITSSGNLQDSPLDIPMTEGFAVFDSVIHNSLGDNTSLTAEDTENSSIGTRVSANFNIRNPGELFISEVTDPEEAASGRYIEIFNHGVEGIDFESQDVFLVIEFNGGTSYRSVKLTGSLGPKSYYLVGQTGFISNYGFSPNIAQEPLPSVASGNGNDTYFLSFGGANNQERIRNYFDIYGEIRVAAVNGTDAWFYENSIAYRKNPPVIQETQFWNEEEWEVAVGLPSDATPGYGNRDYIYVNDTEEWDEIGLGNDFENSDETTNIEIRSGEVTFSSPILVNDLVVRNGAKLIIEDIVTVKGDFVNLGEVIFTSNATKTAVLGEASERSRIRGEFEVHRYFSDANRSFRYLSSPVNSSDNIRANWQEGANNTGTNYPSDNIDTNEGFGTHITGSITGGNGFDATLSGNPSLFTYNNSTESWGAIPNTDNTNLMLGQAYALMVRGNRSTNLTDNTAQGGETILRSLGELHIGDFEVPNLPTLTEAYTLIGNPYQAQVNLKEVSFSDFNTNHVWIWDPNFGSSGGYTLIDLTQTPVQTTPSSGANELLQPGQAFFIETSGTTPSISFQESHKSEEVNNTATFNSPSPNILVNLTNEELGMIDGTRVVFGDEFSNEVTLEDAVKFWGNDEYIAIEKPNKWLSVEKKPLQENDTIQLFTGNYLKTEYQLNIESLATEQVEVVLVDNYLETTTEINSESFMYAFEVDQGISGSMEPTRFQLVVNPIPMSSQDFSSLKWKIYPNPVRGNFLNIEVSEIYSNTAQIQLFNQLGQKVFEAKETYQSQIELRIPNLPKGIYMINFKANEQSWNDKIIVE